MKIINNYYKNNKKAIAVFLTIFFLTTFSWAKAEKVQLDLGNKLIGHADFTQGDEEGTAIILIHGFLQTNNFYTVRRLADALIESGHTVLTPNLSLGISHRKKSMACEAIHTHTIEEDAKEIELWVNWLQQKTKKEIRLIAHSAGSLSALAYFDRIEKTPVQQTILISLYTFGPGPAAYETEQDYQKASQAIQNNDQQLHEFGLSFCKKYVSNAQNYLSYYNWSNKRVDQVLAKPVLKNISTAVIIGSDDKKINWDWINHLKQQKIQYIEVEGANHFFDKQHEFDLLDSIESLLP